MKLFWKYFLWLFSLFAFISYYFLGTELGSQSLGYLLGNYLSKKTDNHITINALNLNRYPHLTIDMNINNTANLILKGVIGKDSLEMNYTLVGESFKWNNLEMKDRIFLEGNVHGPFSSLYVEGAGDILKGKSNYHFVKKNGKMENLKIILEQVSSEKLLTFLDKEPIIHGKVDINASFEYFTLYIKKGDAHISMIDATMPNISGGVPFSLKSDIEFKDIKYLYSGKIDSKIGSLIIKEGMYHVPRKEAKAQYDLNLYELAYFQKFLGHQYQGALKSNGRIHYFNDNYIIYGQTKEFLGELFYEYKDKNLLLNLKGTSLLKLLRQASYPALLDANVYGTVEVNLEDKIILINTELKKAHFLKTKMSNMILKTTGIDILTDVYDKSSFVGGYQNSKLTSILKIDNGRNHIYLPDTVLNAKTNAVNSSFEVRIDGDELYGEIYGTLKDPKVSLDIKKVFQYQIDKGIKSLLRTKKKSNEKINTIKDKATSLFNDLL